MVPCGRACWEIVFDQDAEIEDAVYEVLDQTSTTLASINFVDIIDDEIEPFLGDYSNPDLGDITLYVDEDGTLFFDAGDWVTEIRAYNADGAVNYTMYEMPLAGVDIRLEFDDNEAPIIVVGGGITEYTFTIAE